jgi:penicillin-binding protein 1A
MKNFIRILGYTLLAISTVAFTTVGGLAVYTVSYYTRDIPDHKALKNFFLSAEAEQSFRLVDSLSDQVKLAFIAAENPDFYTRNTPDFHDVIISLIIPSHYPKTNPTITYYVVRQASFQSYDHINPIERGVREIALSVRLEKVLSKDQILALYLNHVYMGHDCYGINAAASYYFGKSPGELNLPEAAYLAGIVKSPSLYGREGDPNVAKDRRDYVIDRMAAEGYATTPQAESAKAQKLEFVPALDQCPSGPTNYPEIFVQP